MSEPSKERPVVPPGETEYVKTTQKKPNDKGFIGYDTDWKPCLLYTSPSPRDRG